jgi:hypothetical protein
MDVGTFKNATDCTIRKELRIGDRMTITTVQTSHILPMTVYITVHEEWSSGPVIGDKGTVCKLECLALIGIMGKVARFTHDLGERLMSGITGGGKGIRESSD